MVRTEASIILPRKIYERPSDLSKNISRPLIVNVVEGGHILQDRYFPHFVEYDITQKHLKKQKQSYSRKS